MTIQEIFDNIDQYSDNIDDLVRSLRSCGINTFDEFKAAARSEGVPIKKSIQDQVAAKYAGLDDDDWKAACDVNTEQSYQEYLDNYPEGNHRSEARNAIANIQQKLNIGRSEAVWNNVDKRDIKQLQDFINQYPLSPYIQEAKRLLHDLRQEQYLGVDIKALEKQIKAIRTDTSINNPERAIYDKIVSYLNSGKITVTDLLSAIEEDNNFISGTVANLLWENGYITDFSATGIDSDFIAHMMSNVTPQKFSKPEPIVRITKSPCTEVYFWGIPSSGKSCALGAILSAAKNGRTAKSMQQDPDCQGYGYMTRLSNLFRSNGSVGTLPEGTAISSTYEMGFILEDEEGKEHPITCIDLAGELVRCMYKQDAGEILTTEQEQVLKTLTDILIDNRTKNRKIHFFVIEYGAEDREYEGLPQQDYLAAAVAYIQRTGIFKKDTDGLYLLVTKVDKAKVVGKELQETLKNYILENYQGFYNGLKKICKDNEINGGKVDIQPFTLGSVCFQSYCKFKEDTAAAVVRTLINRSYGYKPGKWQRLSDSLKK
jgi:hypothetical protein